MIVDPSDPTGIGLFSRCARNHASRTKPNYRPGTPATRPKSHTQEHPKKKPRSRMAFEKQVSREQREKAYKQEETPPVGQYNPVIKKSSKLVWDILKTYTTSKKHHDHKGRPHRDSPQRKQQADKVPPNQDQSIIEGFANKLEEDPSKPLMKSVSPSYAQGNSRSQCMVNMSRMTGRKNTVNDSLDWGESNVMRSLQYIKGSVAKKIDFGRITREKRKRGIVNYPNYDYDLDNVRPIKRSQIDFGVSRGREDRRRKQPNTYSYQHYEYDSYVWQNNSHVYPNTKTHGVDFRKQTDRYKKQESTQ